MVELIGYKVRDGQQTERQVNNMNRENGAQVILHGQTALGIELGSTRIKSVLTDYSGTVLAVGFF